MDKHELAQKTGATNYQKSPRLILDEIRLNGKDGIFKAKKLTEPKDEEGKYKQVDVGKEFSVVFLKVRRQLIEVGSEGAWTRCTNEHDSPNDLVTVFNYNDGGNSKEYMRASDARAKYPNLRTHQLVYVKVKNGKIMRLDVKGSSLGSNNKPKDVMSFYEYLSSFSEEEPFYQYKTNLSSFMEKGKLGEYATIAFKRGDALTEEELTQVIKDIDFVHAETEKQKSFDINEHMRNAAAGVEYKEITEPVVQEEVIEYPQGDEISPDDIPF